MFNPKLLLVILGCVAISCSYEILGSPSISFCSLENCFNPLDVQITTFTMQSRDYIIMSDIYEEATFNLTDEGDHFVCFKNGIRSTYCENLVNQNNLRSVYCSSAMKAKEEYSSCSMNENLLCHCELCEFIFTSYSQNGLVVVDEGLQDVIISVNIENKPINEVQHSMMARGIYTVQHNETFPCKIIESENEICVEMNFDGYKEYSFRKGDYNVNGETYEYEACIRNTNAIKRTSGNMTIIVSNSVEEVFEGKVYLEAFDFCTIFPGVWNMDIWRVRNCWSGWYVFVWTAFWICFPLSVLLIFFGVSWLVYKCYSGWLMSKCYYDSIKLINKALCGCPKYMCSKRAAVIMMFGLVGAQSCTSSLYTDSSLADCLFNRAEGTEVCTFNDVINFEIPFMGGSLCLNLKNANNDTIQTLVITQLAVQARRDFSDTYWTSDWIESSQARLRCYGTGSCDQDMCNDVELGRGGRLAYDQLSNPECYYPGETGCMVGGYVGCPLEESCTYWCYGLVPSNLAVEVAKLDHITLHSILEICSDDVCWTGTVGIETFVEVGGIDLVFDGFLNSGIDYEMNDGVDYYTNFDSIPSIGPASRKNAPTHSMLGDIQAESYDQLVSGDFIFDPEIMRSVTTSGNTANVDLFSSGYSQADTRGDFSPLPSNQKGNVWRRDSGNMYVHSNLTVSIPALYTITFPRDYSVTRYISDVCPNVEDTTHIVGCYNCTEGATFSIFAHSDCSEGAAVLVCEDHVINNPIVNLRNEDQNYTISINSNDKINNWDCVLTDSQGLHTYDFHVSGILQEIELNQEGTNGTVAETEDDDHDCADDFMSRVFDGCGSFWDWTFTISIFGVSALFVIGAVLLLLWSIAMCSGRRAASKLRDIVNVKSDYEIKKEQYTAMVNRGEGLTSEQWNDAIANGLGDYLQHIINMQSQ